METPYKIVVNNLCKSFGKKEVLKNLTLEVAKGSSLVVLGGSGMGKSVLIKCILGLITPNSGDIFIDGVLTTGIMSNKDRAKQISKIKMLFQGGALFDSLTIAENIAFGIPKSFFKGMKLEDFAAEKLSMVGLSADTQYLYPSELSGGMQKRASLARTIATSPEILFFDEPTTGLDPIMSEVINELIIRVTRILGATAITITHDIKSARKIATDIAMLYNGSIVWRGTPSNIDVSGNDIVDQFINGREDGAFTKGLIS